LRLWRNGLRAVRERRRALRRYAPSWPRAPRRRGGGGGRADARAHNAAVEDAEAHNALAVAAALAPVAERLARRRRRALRRYAMSWPRARRRRGGGGRRADARAYNAAVADEGGRYVSLFVF